jgi:ribonuclease-3
MIRSKQPLTKERKAKLIKLQRALGIRFKNQVLLNTALSHKSYVNETTDEELENNEKLEFLGDSFLGLVVSDLLYNQKLYYREGALARIKSYVVSESTLHRVGRNLDFHEYLLIGKGEEKSGGRTRKALISDSLEALIGAYYLDAGYKAAHKFVEKLFYDEIIDVEKNRHEKDYKSILQELVQKRYKIIPRYGISRTEGPDHDRKFYINVNIRNGVYGPGVGGSKKQAEQNAAYLALQALKKKSRMRDEESIIHSEKGKRVVQGGKRAKHRG